MTIRLRIALLVGLALLGAASLAAVDIWAGRRIDRALAAQEGFQHLNDLAAEALTRSQALQIHAEKFIREGDPRFAAAFREDHTRLAEVLSRVVEALRDSPEESRADALRSDIQVLDSDFSALEQTARHLGLSEEDGLRTRLRGSVKAIEGELVMWPNAGPLMMAMLQMRLAEKNFMLYRAEGHLGNHARYAAQFDFALDASSLPASTRQDFRPLLTAYAADMKSFGESSLSLAVNIERLRSRQNRLRPEIEGLHDFARAGMTRAVAEQEATRAETATASQAIGLLATLSFIIAGTIIALGIVRPLRQIEMVMTALASGDHQTAIPCIDRRDEIGDMAKAVAVFRNNAVEMARMQAEYEHVRRDAETASRSKVQVLALRFEDAVKAATEVVSDRADTIHRTAGQIAGSEQAGDNSWSLKIAEAAEQARHTVVAVTDATVQLTRSVDEVAAHGAAVAEVATAAVQELAGAEDRVRGLSETAGRIERVVALIGDIAQRTNMLSLNATIEAQRAGEAGKGFAVVAQEVKRLANQTAQSTREVAAEVAAIQAATCDTVEAIAGIGTAIRRMDALAEEVRVSVAHQADVTRTIERCVADVAAETQTLSDGVAAFTHSAALQCGAAAKVLWAAEDLAEPTRTLKDEVAGFLSSVRAA
jgi:methyl-accepting chemotaxis protein